MDDGPAIQHRLEWWRVQRTLHRQFDGGCGVFDIYEVPRRRLRAHGQGTCFDAAQNVHDASVFEIRLIVKKAAQLLRQQGHRSLCMFAGLEPIVVHSSEARVRSHRGHRLQLHDVLQQLRQLVLALA